MSLSKININSYLKGLKFETIFIIDRDYKYKTFSLPELKLSLEKDFKKKYSQSGIYQLLQNLRKYNLIEYNEEESLYYGFKFCFFKSAFELELENIKEEQKELNKKKYLINTYLNKWIKNHLLSRFINKELLYYINSWKW